MIRIGTGKSTSVDPLKAGVTESHSSPQRRLAILLLLFFLSGASGLTYQIVWLKFLNLAFGVTIYAVSTVLAGFMAGLALGSFAAGRVADKVHHPLRLYGLLELLIGGVGLLSPSAFLGLHEAYKWLHPLLPDALLPVSLARFVLAFGILLIPTSLMGATLPIAIKSSLVTAAGLGRGISLLYALNTFGAVAGTFAAGMFLIGELGLQATIIIAAGINGIVGLGAIVLDSIVSRSSIHADGPSQPEVKLPSRGEAEYHRPVLTAVLVVFGLSGFTSLAYEVVWARILTFFTNGSTYAYTIMLSTVLLGIALGSFLVNHFINRRADWLLVLVGLEFGIGLTSLISIKVVSEIYQVLGWAGALPLVGSLVNGRAGFMTAAMALAILPTTLLLGVAFPIGLRIFSSGHSQVGRRVGNLYALNVFGSILGSFVAGFVLVPLLGSQRSLTFLALVTWFMVLLLIWSAGMRYAKRLRFGIVLASGAAMVLMVAVAPDMYQRIFEDRFPAEEVLWYEEGLETSVNVNRTREGGLVMYMNGRHQADTTPRVAGLHQLIGHVPMLLHPDPQDVLIIGLGGGATAGAISQHPTQQIDLVEISESVVRAADYFADINNSILSQPNVNLRLDDGRNYLLLTGKKYDVIAADIIQPYHAGSGNLYSEEYFRMAQNALDADGMMVQWIGDPSESHYNLIIRTFVSVFPYVTLWSDGHIMVGTLRPLRLDLAVINAKLTDQRLRAALAPLGIGSAEDVLRMYNGNRTEMLIFAGPGPISTDNQPYNEYYRSIPVSQDEQRVSGGPNASVGRVRGNAAEMLVR